MDNAPPKIPPGATWAQLDFATKHALFAHDPKTAAAWQAHPHRPIVPRRPRVAPTSVRGPSPVAATRSTSTAPPKFAVGDRVRHNGAETIVDDVADGQHVATEYDDGTTHRWASVDPGSSAKVGDTVEDGDGRPAKVTVVRTGPHYVLNSGHAWASENELEAVGPTKSARRASAARPTPRRPPAPLASPTGPSFATRWADMAQPLRARLEKHDPVTASSMRKTPTWIFHLQPLALWPA